MEKTIITAALSDNKISITNKVKYCLEPEEIVRNAISCWKAGAAIIHLFMRYEKNQGLMYKNRFIKTVALIRNECDAIINLTISDAYNTTDDERLEHIIAVDPDVTTFEAQVCSNPIYISKISNMMNLHNIKLGVEVFDNEILEEVNRCVKERVLRDSVHFQIALGVLNEINGAVNFKNRLPSRSTWSVLGGRQSQLSKLNSAIGLGGHVQVGCKEYNDKLTLDLNIHLVEQAVQRIGSVDKYIATPDDARAILDIKNKKKEREESYV